MTYKIFRITNQEARKINKLLSSFFKDNKEIKNGDLIKFEIVNVDEELVQQFRRSFEDIKHGRIRRVK